MKIIILFKRIILKKKKKKKKTFLNNWIGNWNWSKWSKFWEYLLIIVVCVDVVVKRLNVSLNLFVIDVACLIKLFFICSSFLLSIISFDVVEDISSSSIFNVFNLILSKSNCSSSSFLSKTISSFSLKFISFSSLHFSPINVHSFKPFSIKSF